MLFCRCRSLGRLLVVFGLVCSWSNSALCFTPDSPEVKKMVARGVDYLNSATERRFGGDCLVGLALFKAGQPASHAKIIDAVQNCRLRVSKAPEEVEDSIYAIGIAIIFLCELDPQKYKHEITRLVDLLLARQKSMGAWGYPPGNAEFRTGDTSMTQYAVLGAWATQRTGTLEFPVDSLVQVCNWLLRTQDPSGAWGYQGVDPGEGNYNRTEQKEVRHSLAAAGLSSLYICADLLGFTHAVEVEEVDPSLPKALKAVKEKRPPNAPGSPRTDAVAGVLIRKGMKDGDNWFANNYRINPKEWPHYYMYAYERYQSFRELASGRLRRESRWYNDGVQFLRETQNNDGSWYSDAGRAVDTSFAMLFLLRSTQRSIKKAMGELGVGVLIGGRGLPQDVSEVKLEDGKIVRSPLRASADELFEILEMAGDVDAVDAVIPTEIILTENLAERAVQLRKLRRLATHEDFAIRATSVKTLATTRDFNNIPALIYALTDPDVRIVVQARDGLRFISRKFAGFGLSDRPDGQEKRQAAQQWKDWFRSIRPDADFLN